MVRTPSSVESANISLCNLLAAWPLSIDTKWGELNENQIDQPGFCSGGLERIVGCLRQR
jgi:hypothetical protein